MCVWVNHAYYSGQEGGKHWFMQTPLWLFWQLPPNWWANFYWLSSSPSRGNRSLQHWCKLTFQGKGNYPLCSFPYASRQKESATHNIKTLVVTSGSLLIETLFPEKANKSVFIWLRSRTSYKFKLHISGDRGPSNFIEILPQAWGDGYLYKSISQAACTTALKQKVVYCKRKCWGKASQEIPSLTAGACPTTFACSHATCVLNFFSESS